MTVETKTHDIACTQRQVGLKYALLRHVADSRVAAPCRTPQNRDRPGLRLNQAEQALEQCGLARAVWPQHGDKLSRVYRQVYILQNDTSPQTDTCMLDFDNWFCS